MAEPIVNVDPRIYGGDAPTGNAVPEFDPMGAAPTPEPAQASAPEKVAQTEIGAGTMSAAIGQNTIAQNARPLATVGDAALAAAKSWSPVRVWDYINMPHFDRDPDFDPKPYINQVPFMMSEDEQKFFAQSRSLDEFNYRLQNTQTQRALYAQMGDHPIVSTLVGMADPGYLALDLASGGVATALQTGRVAAGVMAATATLGLGAVQAQVVPMSDTEIILPALLSGAATAMAYRPKKGLVQADPEYPSDVLGQAAADVRGQSTGAEKRIVSEQETVSRATPTVEQEVERTAALVGTDGATIAKGAAVAEESTLEATFRNKELLAERGVKAGDPVTDAYTYLGRFEDDAEFGPMIRVLREEQPDLLNKLKVMESELDRNATPFYSAGSHSVHMPTAEHMAANPHFPQRNLSAFAALHEVMHGLTVHKLAFGMANPGTAHGRITAELQDLLNRTRVWLKDAEGLTASQLHDATYLTKNLNEFVAGLYSGNIGGLPTILSRMPVGAGSRAPNMLSKMVDTVRKLLGIPPTQTNALTRALGLTDELINTKLNVKVEGTAEVPGMSLHSAPATAPTGTPGQQAATIVKRMESAAAKTGNAISWSLHKTVSGLGSAGKKVADLLVDDPVNMTGDSVVSQKQAIRSDLSQLQYRYEDGLKEAMASRGAGLRNRILNPRKSAEIQHDIEKQVYAELQRRNTAARRGLPTADPSVDPMITKLADAHDAATAQALKEMQAAGVMGADAVDEAAGYAPRKWSVTQIEDMENRIAAANGVTEKQSRSVVRKMVASAIQKANPMWDADAISDVAAAIIERARRKGYFEDQAFRGHVGNSGAKEVRDILAQTPGITADRIQKAMEVITGVTDEAGKASALKHRVAMDTSHSLQLADGSRISVMDLLDTNVARNLDGYLDNAAGNSALARKSFKNAKGEDVPLNTSTAIDQLRTEFLHGVADEGSRKKAAALFDNIIASIKGQPVGDEVGDGMRRLAAITQMVGLSGSGLWQLTEYSNAMAKYGLIKTTKEIMRTLPVFKTLMGGADHDPASLAAILARNSSQDLRIRPYIQKMEDNFEMSLGDHVGLSLQQAKQIVPYINAMHYIHHNQARVVGNLVADVFHKGALGDKAAQQALAKYGLEGHTLSSVAADIKANGLNTAAWSDATWAQIRGPLGKMMDDAVLKNRTGEIPAFAQFSSVGKFIFTFRSFVLGAHNKVLAGSLGREGFGGMGLLMMYQFPLTMLASQANSMLKGQGPLDLNTAASTALSQMGAMGLLSELWGVASGDKQQFGASGLMAIDRLYKTGSSLANGQFGTAASGAINSIPLLSIIPGVKAMAETLKDGQQSK